MKSLLEFMNEDLSNGTPLKNINDFKNLHFAILNIGTVANGWNQVKFVKDIKTLCDVCELNDTNESHKQFETWLKSEEPAITINNKYLVMKVIDPKNIKVEERKFKEEETKQ